MRIWVKLGIGCVLTRSCDGECLDLTSPCVSDANIFSRIGPEKGVIHLATAAVNNALWDMFARARGKPLWKLIVDMTPVCHIYFTLVPL